ncbi:MAG TPA: hypothetical protein VFO34_09105 [Candidatus Acidoferrales bacterium]|nr:hypothetical protein [Candidatus Acidoferrales bacterium]
MYAPFVAYRELAGRLPAVMRPAKEEETLAPRGRKFKRPEEPIVAGIHQIVVIPAD